MISWTVVVECPQCGMPIYLSACNPRQIERALSLHLAYGCSC
ncbi:hypothetical protein [Streptosporangium roseum]